MENKDVSNLLLSKLENAKLCLLGRCSNMLWMVFENEQKKEYSFHVQCPWRFVKSNETLLASGDFYLPNSGSMEEDNFQWDIYGNNVTK